MKNLLDLPLFDVLAKISTEHRGLLTVEQGLRDLMFMQAIAEEIKAVGPKNIDLNLIQIHAKDHGGHDELDMEQIALYSRLAALTYRLVLP